MPEARCVRQECRSRQGAQMAAPLVLLCLRPVVCYLIGFSVCQVALAWNCGAKVRRFFVAAGRLRSFGADNG